MTAQTETTQEAARRFSMERGSASAAIADLDVHFHSADFRMAVGNLASLETGTSIEWKWEEKAAEWLAALEAHRIATVEKTALTLNFAAAA